MKNVWRRALSLLLSGVLLVSNVPFAALATEEQIVEEIFEEVVETQVTEAPVPEEVVEERPAQTVVQLDPVVDDVRNIQITGGTGVTKNEETNTVTLNGQTVETIESTDEGMPLTVVLTEGTANSIQTLKSVNGIVITGKGVLTVESIQAGENLEIVDAVVKVGTDKGENEEAQTLITVKNTITISGNAHVKTAVGHTAVVFTDTAEGAAYSVAGDGYCRNDAEFEEVVSEAVVTEVLTDFEYLSLEHIADDSVHIKKCKCSEPTTVIDDKHTAVYEWSENEPSMLTENCSACNQKLNTYEVKAANDLVWNGAEKEATFDNTLSSTLTYYKVENGVRGEQALDGAPAEPGSYVVEVSIENTEYKPYVGFIIEKKSLTSDMISEIPDKEYTGLNTEPEVDVTDLDGTEYEITFYRGEDETEDFSSVGTITVRVTAKDECAHYTGSAESEYTIAKAHVIQDFFDVTIPEDEAYDGTAKEATAKIKGAYANAGIGEITVKYYFKDEEVTEAKAAGTYTVKLDVKGGKNYEDAENLENASWKFTITPAPIEKDETELPDQTILKSKTEFAEPKIFDENGNEVTGSWSYELSETKTGLTLSQLNLELAKLDTATVKYVFTASGNHQGTIEGSIQINVVEIAFTVADGENQVAATKDNAVTINKETIFYGETNFLTLNQITANVSGVETTEGFSVKLEPEIPVVGDQNTYVVLFDGTAFGLGDKIEVCRGNFTVEKRTPTYTAPTAKEIPANGVEQALINAGTTNGGTMLYSLDNTNWGTEIPTGTEAAAYWVYWKIEGDENNVAVAGDKVTAVIYPALTATYGDYRSSLVAQLPEGFSLSEPGDADAKVGNAGAQTIKLDYTHPDDAGKTVAKYEHPWLDDYSVDFTVQPKKVKLNVTLNDQYLPYNAGNKVAAAVTVKIDGKTEAFDSREYTTVCTNITNTADTEVKNPGKAQIQVVSNGNYEFTNTEAELKKEYVVYWSTGLSFPDSWKFEDYGNTDMKQAGFEDGEAAKAELDKKLDAEDYPAAKRDYYNLVMKEKDAASTSGSKYVYDSFYWPNDGVTFSMSYPTDTDQEDTFKIYAMYTVDRSDLNTTAGTIIELTETTEGKPGINEYKKTEGKIQVNLKNYAAICIAVKENADKEYSITAKTNSSSKGTVSFKVGTSSTAKTAKAGENITVTATAKSGYQLSRLNYTYNNGTKDVTTAIEKNSSGKYTFTMPAANVTINAQFDKKGTNANTGDSSNIYLWLTILAASAVGIVALVIVWWKKRKK